MGLGGREGEFDEHLAQWEGNGYDWGLHYRIFGNHFGNALRGRDEVAGVRGWGGGGRKAGARGVGGGGVAIFSATSCAFSYDISFPTSFYDFEVMDRELQELANKSSAVFPWESKLEKARFRGSCWYYKNHGRTAAFTMAQVAPDLVDADWYEEVRTSCRPVAGVECLGYGG